MRVEKVELGLGITSAVVGCLIVIYGLFGPVICSAGPSPKSCTSVAMEEGFGAALPLLITFGLLFAGIAFGSAKHALHDSRRGLALLGIATLLLLALALLSLPSIGFYLLPSVLLALLALVLGLIGLIFRLIFRRDRETAHAGNHESKRREV